jgi:hypothetical protein
MRKHGLTNFDWQVVDRAKSIEQLNYLETLWANRLRHQGIILYNNRETGNNKKHRPDSIKKMQQVHKLRHACKNIGGWKRKDGGAMKGKKQSLVSCINCKKVTGSNIFARYHNGRCEVI